jgi:hypothetical protein
MLVDLFRCLVRLYPGDVRRAFGPAMVAAFSEGRADHAARPWAHRAAFVARELRGVTGGVFGEWIAVATAAPFQRQMLFPDPSRMRPPGMSRREWMQQL